MPFLWTPWRSATRVSSVSSIYPPPERTVVPTEDPAAEEGGENGVYEIGDGVLMSLVADEAAGIMHVVMTILYLRVSLHY